MSNGDKTIINVETALMKKKRFERSFPSKIPCPTPDVFSTGFPANLEIKWRKKTI